MARKRILRLSVMTGRPVSVQPPPGATAQPAIAAPAPSGSFISTTPSQLGTQTTTAFENLACYECVVPIDLDNPAQIPLPMHQDGNLAVSFETKVTPRSNGLDEIIECTIKITSKNQPLSQPLRD